MAQKTSAGKEETEFKVVPETLTLCVNNCGFTGNPATNNMCQKCFNTKPSLSSSSSSSSSIISSSLKNNNINKAAAEACRSSGSRSPAARDLKRPVKSPEESKPPAKREVNRCSGCRRKVGLTGFRCRCGELFCADHRYSDRHDCSYDYKAAAREAIARDNPVVKAAKMVKI